MFYIVLFVNLFINIIEHSIKLNNILVICDDRIPARHLMKKYLNAVNSWQYFNEII